MRRIALLVTHLMGSGHLVRILAIARALRAAGAVPVVISGGRPLPHLDTAGVPVVQLPPVTIRGTDYGSLVTPDGRTVDDAYRAARRAALLAALAAHRPEALVIEHWPFGRRMLADEALAALDALPGVPAVASLRDVLEPPRRPERVAETTAHAARFSCIMVHGDAAVLPLEASWPGDGPLPPSVAARLSYTGYVASPMPEPIPCPDTVLVAVGSGVIGRPLLRLAAQASGLSPLRWHLMVGGADAEAAAAALRPLGPATVEPARADYRARLGGAAVSLSLAGYNTAVELLQTGTPGLLVPMQEGGEREQAIRAAAFAGLPGLRLATLDGLTPQGLALLARHLAQEPRRGGPRVAMEGAATAARLILAQL